MKNRRPFLHPLRQVPRAGWKFCWRPQPQPRTAWARARSRCGRTSRKTTTCARFHGAVEMWRPTATGRPRRVESAMSRPSSPTAEDNSWRWEDLSRWGLGSSLGQGTHAGPAPAPKQEDGSSRWRGHASRGAQRRLPVRLRWSTTLHGASNSNLMEKAHIWRSAARLAPRKTWIPEAASRPVALDPRSQSQRLIDVTRVGKVRPPLSHGVAHLLCPIRLRQELAVPEVALPPCQKLAGKPGSAVASLRCPSRAFRGSGAESRPPWRWGRHEKPGAGRGGSRRWCPTPCDRAGRTLADARDHPSTLGLRPRIQCHWSRAASNPGLLGRQTAAIPGCAPSHEVRCCPVVVVDSEAHR